MIIPVLQTGSLGLFANSFMFYFTGRPALLFTFPSRYLFTIGFKSYLALEDGSPRFPRCMCTEVLRILLGPDVISHTRLSLSMVNHSRLFCYSVWSPTSESYNHPQRAQALSADFGLLRFRSPLLTQSHWFLFLSLLRCFSSGGTLFLSYLLCKQNNFTW